MPAFLGYASARVFKGCGMILAAAKGATNAAATGTTAVAANRMSSSTKRSPLKSSATISGRVGSGSKPRSNSFSLPLPVSAALRDFIGAPEASRAGVLKKVWEYIKLHNLQNPADRRVIMCDEKLKTIFAGKDQVGMLEIGKLLASHFV